MGKEDHYEAEVNQGDVNMGHLTRQLNERWKDGWRLAHIYEHQGNTVMVWERRAGE